MARPGISIGKKVALLLFGAALSVVILESGLRLGGFLLLSLQEYRDMASARRKDVYRIMCLGESVTAGNYLSSYPAWLEKILNQNNRSGKFSVINKAMARTDSTYILNDLERNLNLYKPDMVIIMTGINDTHIRYYGTIPAANGVLFNRLRAYRFARFVWMHILNKAKKRDIYGQPYQNAVQFAPPKREPIEKYHKGPDEKRPPVTLRNYLKIKAALDEKGVKLVCAQYPMRSIEGLKEMFIDRKGIVFVDNEAVFKEAVNKSGYMDYFEDMFAGDFGHCTDKGNRLLAENIARVISEEVSSKQ